MAKANFHRHQRVYVTPVGTWALIEKVNPVWVKGFDEPVRVTYDCGLGRDFGADELQSLDETDEKPDRAFVTWRLTRSQNKWQSLDECAHHPFPGSYPTVVTDPTGWGGWRVSAAEYDRDPDIIEHQARLMVKAPALHRLVEDLISLVISETDRLPEDLITLAQKARQVIGDIEDPVNAKRLAETPR